MNRQQRRAAEKAAAALPLEALLREGARCQASGQMREAGSYYERALTLAPVHAELLNNLGCVYLDLGRLKDASAAFARVIDAKASILDDSPGILNTLVTVAPMLRDARARALAQWPTRLSAGDLFDAEGFAAAAADPLLRQLMRSVAIRDVGFERLMTGLRRALLLGRETAAPVPRRLFDFYGALAEQCFINEYVYATTADEDEALLRLRARLEAPSVPTAMPRDEDYLAFACYAPLSALADADVIQRRRAGDALAHVITQQIDEPAQETALRATIGTLTPIDDVVSRAVQAQYEEHPYPRWVKVATSRTPEILSVYLARMIPGATFSTVPDRPLDILVAGCGTGRHAIELAASIDKAQVLAIDLSRTSLAYAMRKTPPALAPRLDYRQADILKLAGMPRTFDVISSAGVLHHMAEPLAAWKTLASLLRPNGFMHVGLYSETARRAIVDARAFIAQRGYPATAEGIRQCRQDIIDTPSLAPITGWGDFYSMSDCRDLLFHVQEQRFTIAQIKRATEEMGLRFLGFVLSPPDSARWRATFAQRGWTLDDLDRWDAVERDHPDLFAGMYQFWVQKA